MKNLLLVAVMVMAVCSSTFTMNHLVSEETPLIKVLNVEGKVFNLYLANLEKNNTVVSIKDLAGNVFFQEQVKNHNGFAKKINMENLKDGRYLLTVKQQDKEFIQVVVVEDATLVFSKVSEK